MKNKTSIAILAPIIIISTLFVSCNNQQPQQDQATTGTAVSTNNSDFIADYTDRDLDPSWDASSAVYITLADGSSSVSGSGALISGDIVTISKEGTYVISGQLSDGQIVVDAASDVKLQLVLNGADIHCESGPAIYIKSADKVFLTLEGESQNSVSDGANYVLAAGDDEPYATIFSKDDLTINGEGSLTVSANYRIAIASKDDLVITGGALDIKAVDHAIRGRDCVKIWDGDFSIECGGDAIKSNNDTDTTLGYVYIDGGTYEIAAAGDGIQAETYLRVTGGSGSIVSGGGSENAVVNNAGADDFGMGGFGGGRPQEGFGGMQPGGGGMQPGNAPVEGEPTSLGAVVPDDPAETDNEDDSSGTKGIKSGAELYICGGEFTLDCADDAIHCNGNISIVGGDYTLTTGDDGVHADEALVVDGGSIEILESYEGLEGLSVAINGGSISVIASDDGINAAGGNDGSGFGPFGGGATLEANENMFIEISGGTIFIDATGDGIDSNGDLRISGGVVLVCGPENSANAAIDCDQGTGTITGGVVVAVGYSGMAQGFSSNSTQAGFMYQYSATQQAGSAVTVVDGSGEIVVHFTPTRSYNNLIVSAPALAQGSSYTILSGASAANADENGFCQSGAYSGGNEQGEITLSSVFTGGSTQQGAPGFGAR